MSHGFHYKLLYRSLYKSFSIYSSEKPCAVAMLLPLIINTYCNIANEILHIKISYQMNKLLGNSKMGIIIWQYVIQLLAQLFIHLSEIFWKQTFKVLKLFLPYLFLLKSFYITQRFKLNNKFQHFVWLPQLPKKLFQLNYFEEVRNL